MIRKGITTALLIGAYLGVNAQNNTIVDVVTHSPEHKTLAYFMQTDDPSGEYVNGGFYTVFAPNDAAMKMLPADIVKNMRDPQYADVTHSIINYHILAGKFTEQDIVNAIKKGNGYATFKTIQGGKVVFSAVGNYIKITDSEGHVANIRFNGVAAGNGLVHTIDKVLMPKDEPQQTAKGVAGY